MRFGKDLRAALTALGKALFPDMCTLCGRFYDRPHERPPLSRAGGRWALADWLCDDCQTDAAAATIATATPSCPRCGLPFRNDAGSDHLCGDCRTRPGVFTRARAVGGYDGALKDLILKFKFEGRVGLALPLGRLAWETFERHWRPAEIDLVLPVPLHPRRMRRRRYNQAYLLMRRWPDWHADRHEVPAPWRIARDLLRRRRATRPQTGLRRPAREKNLRDAFAISDPSACKGRRILLVDDIFTTGATVNACARTLLSVGAQQVDALTLARAL